MGEATGARPDPAPELVAFISEMARPGFPTVLVVEDIQDADPGLLHLVRQITTPSFTDRVLVVATGWPEGLMSRVVSGTPLGEWLSAIGAQKIDVDVLDAQARRDLVLARYPDTRPRLVDAIASRWPRPLHLVMVLAQIASNNWVTDRAVVATEEQIRWMPPELPGLYDLQFDGLPIHTKRTLALFAACASDPATAEHPGLPPHPDAHWSSVYPAVIGNYTGEMDQGAAIRVGWVVTQGDGWVEFREPDLAAAAWRAILPLGMVTEAGEVRKAVVRLLEPLAEVLGATPPVSEPSALWRLGWWHLELTPTRPGGGPGGGRMTYDDEWSTRRAYALRERLLWASRLPGRTAVWVAWAEQLRAAAGGDPWADQMLLVVGLLRAGHPAVAAAVLSGLSGAPDTPLPSCLIPALKGNTARLTGRYRDAVRFHTQALSAAQAQQDAPEWSFRVELALSHAAAGDRAAAIAELERILAPDKDQPWIAARVEFALLTAAHPLGPEYNRLPSRDMSLGEWAGWGGGYFDGLVGYRELLSGETRAGRRKLGSAFDWAKRALGRKHPDAFALEALEARAAMYEDTRHHVSAVKILERLIPRMETALGVAHLDTVVARGYLAAAYNGHGPGSETGE